MKTKQKLPAILLMFAAVAGARGIIPTLSESGNLKPRNVENLHRPTVAERMAAAEETVKAYPFKTLARTNLPMRTAGDKKERLDSVVGYNSDGSKYIRMYCEYGPDGLMTKQTNSFWNSETNDWDHIQVYEYAWDPDGYCLRMSNFAYGYGERMDFKYNDDKLCIEQIKYNAESDGVWKQWYKGEYEYDAKGNMTAEKGCLWDGTQWNDSFRTTATYDENNLMTGIESYEYIDGVWRGSEKQEYVNFTANKLSDKYMYRWDDAEAKWVSAQHFIQEWSSQGHLLAQRMRYWNADDQSWNGDYSSWGTSEICKNYDAEMEYDDKWRITRQAHTDWYNKGAEKHLSSEMITKWTDNADGTSQSEMNAYLYSYPDNKKIWNQRQYKKFDVNDSIIWDNQQLGNYDGTAMLDYYETKYAYDEQGHCIYEATWDFDDDGRRIPSIEQRDVYNDQNQIIEQTFRMNDNGGGMKPFTSARRVPEITDEDNEGWVYSSHFTYEHDHDITISKLKYKWNVGNGEWMPSDGSVVKFDFKMPASDIILPIDYVDLYKIEKIDNYTGDGIGSDWTIAPQLYFYSGVSSVKDIPTDGTPLLQFAGRTLSVRGTCTDCTHNIYDLAGRLIMQAQGAVADLSGIAPGIYVVNSSIDGVPATLRILCK